MGEINLEQREIEAIKGVDESDLSKLIDEAIEAERLGDLYRLRLRDCVSIRTATRYLRARMRTNRLWW